MKDQNKPPKQRLTIFLDGTWNTQDDSTNILHAHALTFEGLSEDGFIQKRYYDRGVGTGMFESVLGGGFGVGLEVNVREAYNWLVDNYNEEDEIYIFGFSRGAFTARSLVGFISKCGLIRRGAPLTNSQLWDGYVKISQQRNKKNTLLSKVRKSVKPPFRSYKNIRKGDKKNNNTENLLKQWSRRVKITYLGIFDTVGAMGLEALGIQGIRSRSGLNHNQNPTKLILKCRHALAIDENRSSFRLTPFLHYVPQSDTKEEVEDGGYQENISQKWFIGAHSNIGGGYNDNLLAYYPLDWVLEGAKNEGLQIRKLTPSDLPAAVNQVNDSYKDFTGIVWPHIFREKRHYRPIDQSGIVIAGKYGKRDPKTRISKQKEPGFSLIPIYEEIDKSVLTLIKAEKDDAYVPINLKNYANRITVKTKINPEDKLTEKEKIDNELKSLFANRTPNEKWLDSTILARIILVCWSTLAALGVAFSLDRILINHSFIEWEFIAMIALIFSISDCAEFHFNLKTGLNSSDIISKVSLNVLMWIRFLGITFFFIGIIGFILECIDWGLYSDLSIKERLDFIKEKNWYLIPFFPMIAVLLLDLFYNGIKNKAGEFILFDVLRKTFGTILSPFIFLLFGFLITYLSGYLIGFSSSDELLSQSTYQYLTPSRLAGQLLIIQFLLLILNYIFVWVGKPTRRTRIGFVIIRLQFSYTPDQIRELFKVTSHNISRLWKGETKKERKSIAWNNAGNLIRESLWRDILGFIPAYTFIFGVIMWLVSTYGLHENWTWLNTERILDFPLWIWIISVTAIADYFENFIHLRHVKNFPKGLSSTPLVITGVVFTIIKYLGFIPAFLITIGIYFNLSCNILCADPGGWRWLIALFITLMVIYIAIGLGKNLIQKRFFK